MPLDKPYGHGGPPKPLPEPTPSKSFVGVDQLVAEKIMEWKFIDRHAAGWGPGPVVWATGEPTNDDAHPNSNPTFQDFRPSEDFRQAFMVRDKILNTWAFSERLKFKERLQWVISRRVFSAGDPRPTAPKMSSRFYAFDILGDLKTLPASEGTRISTDELVLLVLPVDICLAALEAKGILQEGRYTVRADEPPKPDFPIKRG